MGCQGGYEGKSPPERPKPLPLLRIPLVDPKRCGPVVALPLPLSDAIFI